MDIKQLVDTLVYGQLQEGKGPYPFAEKERIYGGHTLPMLHYALKDAKETMEIWRSHNEKLRNTNDRDISAEENENYYADDCHTIGDEIRRRARKEDLPADAYEYEDSSIAKAHANARGGIVHRKGHRYMVTSKLTKAKRHGWEPVEERPVDEARKDIHPIVRNIVGRLHVSASQDQVEAAIRGAMKKPKNMSTEDFEKHVSHFVGQGLAVHNENRALYGKVMSGRF